MRFAQVDEGVYRIYAGALDAPPGQGYIAAAIISHRGGPQAPPREAWRDMNLRCGQRWQSADEALRYAIATGRRLIRTDPRRLARAAAGSASS